MNHFQKFYHKDLQKSYKKFLYPYDKKSIIISIRNKTIRGKYNKIVLDNLINETYDIFNLLANVKNACTQDAVVLISYYNHLWEPLLNIATKLNLRKKSLNQNWIDDEDISNFLNLTGFQVISFRKRMLMPFNIPLITPFMNDYVANLPLINNLCLSTLVVARPINNQSKDLTVSIIIPSRNEEGNIPKIVPSIPKFGKSQEIIFVEGNSKDNTWNEIVKASNKYKNVKYFKQKGQGKADAVWLGFEKAEGDVLVIYDADRTVDAKELPRFYNLIKENPHTFINGSRLVYPMESQAMMTLNKLGNKVFGYLFTWILGQRFKDTLCGTKVILKTDYFYIKKYYQHLFRIDPFGDFALIFGSLKSNLKIIELPIRYKDREYGSTNISRFKHGFILLNMTIKAFKEFRL